MTDLGKEADLPTEESAKTFFEKLPTDGTPVPIKTKSGLGEELLLALKIVPVSEITSSYTLNRTKNHGAYLDAEPISLITVIIFAQGNGLIHPEGRLGIVGHRDLILARKGNGEVVIGSGFRTNDYLPTDQVVDSESRKRFSVGGNNSVERLHIEDEKSLHDRWPTLPEPTAQKIKEIIAKGDPYARGLGRLMQAVALRSALKLGASILKPDNLYSDGIKMWQEFGIQATKGQESLIDRGRATRIIDQTLSSHI